MGNFCEWAPWVFALLGIVTGWLLRWWYDDGMIAEYKERIQEKTDDIYHLNEAQSLLLRDKNSKITAHKDELILKDRVINELNTEVDHLKSQISKRKNSKDARKSSVKVVNKEVISKSDNVFEEVIQLDPNSIVTIIDKKAKEKNLPIVQVSQIEEVITDKDDYTSISQESKKSKTKKRRKKKSKSRRLKKQLAKRDQQIKELVLERDELKAKVAQLPKELIKERPIKITKTILVKESVDKKKLKEALQNIPIKKSKKVLDQKVKKGKLKIVSS